MTEMKPDETETGRNWQLLRPAEVPLYTFKYIITEPVFRFLARPEATVGMVHNPPLSPKYNLVV